MEKDSGNNKYNCEKVLNKQAEVPWWEPTPPKGEEGVFFNKSTGWRYTGFQRYWKSAFNMLPEKGDKGGDAVLVLTNSGSSHYDGGRGVYTEIIDAWRAMEGLIIITWPDPNLFGNVVVKVGETQEFKALANSNIPENWSWYLDDELTDATGDTFEYTPTIDDKGYHKLKVVVQNVNLYDPYGEEEEVMNHTWKKVKVVE
ncbi:MAG: hypothetical protein J7L53_10100, partial [Deltaproteobacteria bacterium]|nr:hypothetical protein [Deltaproteobacteria bacterium]